jgi:hypothetical protein
VVFPEGARNWTARVLEHDLSAGGRTIEGALDTLLKMTRAHIGYDVRHGREPLSTFAAAPHMYWNAFAVGTRITMPLQIEAVESIAPTTVVAAVAREHPLFSRSTPRFRIA